MIDLKEIFSPKLINVATVSIATIIAGNLILNDYLNQFNIVDYNVLKPLAIKIGVVCLAFLGGHFFLMASFLNWENIFKENLRKVLFGGILKYLFVINVLVVTLEPKVLSQGINGSQAEHVFLSLTYSVSLFTPLILTFVKNLFRSKIYTISYNILFGLGILANLLAFICGLAFKKLLPIYEFESYIFLLFVAAMFGLYMTQKFPGQAPSFFAPTLKNTAIPSFFDKTILTIGYLGILVGCVHLYATKIFTRIPADYGGGKVKTITYKVSGDFITGKKIYENQMNIFLLMNDTAIHKIDVQKVDVIQCNSNPYNSE